MLSEELGRLLYLHLIKMRTTMIMRTMSAMTETASMSSLLTPWTSPPPPLMPTPPLTPLTPPPLGPPFPVMTSPVMGWLGEDWMEKGNQNPNRLEASMVL